MFVMQLTPPAPPDRHSTTTPLSSTARLKEEAIAALLADQRLTCHFQPIVNRQQGRIFAYEALCRTVGGNPFDTIEELRSIGVQPDFIVCRSDHEIEDGVREKIALFCDVATEDVLACVDSPSIYEVPLALDEQGFDVKVLDKQFEGFMEDAPLCDQCGAITVRNGACYRCYNCGNSMGCS